MPRFGPVAPDAPPGRRRLLDHLRASGRYYWTQGLRSRLVVAARDAALRRIARAQPDFAAAPQAERVARLASLAGISREEAALHVRRGCHARRRFHPGRPACAAHPQCTGKGGK